MRALNWSQILYIRACFSHIYIHISVLAIHRFSFLSFVMRLFILTSYVRCSSHFYLGAHCHDIPALQVIKACMSDSCQTYLLWNKTSVLIKATLRILLYTFSLSVSVAKNKRVWQPMSRIYFCKKYDLSLSFVNFRQSASLRLRQTSI